MKDVITSPKKLINDMHLKNIFINDSYLELGIIDVKVIKRLLNYELINIDEITYFPVQNKGLGHSKLQDSMLRNYMPFHFFRNLSENNPKVQLFITYGLLQYRTHDNHENFMPIILIPISIYFENEDILVQMTSSPMENPLIYSVINNSKIFFLQTHSFKDIYSLDDILVTIDKIGDCSVRLDNYLTYGQIKEKDIILSYKSPSNRSGLFSERNKTEHNLFDRIYLSNREDIYTSMVLNKIQREALGRLNNGESLNITGYNGTGKTTVLKNFIVNNLSNNKKTLYISNSKESIKEIKEFLEQLMLTNYVVDLTDSFKRISKNLITESYYDPTDSIEPLIEQLTGYYQKIKEYEEDINKKLYGFKFIEMIYHKYLIDNDLASKVDDKWIKIDSLSNVYKHEYEEIKNVLNLIEKNFKEIQSFRNSVWKEIPIINNITHDNQVFNVVFQLNTGLKKLREYEIALGNYGVKSISSFSEMKKYIEPMDELVEEEIPVEWKKDILTYTNAKNKYNDLKEDIFKYQQAEYNLGTKYKNVNSIDIEEEIDNLFKDFYQDNQLDIIEKLLINKAEVKRIIKTSNIDILDFNNLFDELSKLLNFNFLEKDEYLNEIIYLYELLNNNSICGRMITLILHNRVDSELSDLHNLYKNIIQLNDEILILEKKNPKFVNLDFSKGNVKYENELYRTYDTKQKKAKKLIRDYYELVGFSYLQHEKNVASINALKEYYELIKNKKYRKIIVDFIQSLDEEGYYKVVSVLKIFVSAYNNILDSIKYFEKYLISFDNLNVRMKVDYLKKYLDYVNNLYLSNERMNSIILDNELEYVKPIEYFNLKVEIDKLNEIINYLKNNQEYYEFYGYLYQAHETNVLNILKIIHMFDGYISVFVSENAIYNSFKNYKDLREVVDAVVQLVNEIGENLRLYSLIFKDSVSRYYFSNIENNVEYLTKLLDAKNELTLYLNITHGIGVLDKYKMHSIIEFIVAHDDVSGISAKFSEVYFEGLIKEYLKKYNSLKDTKDYIETLNKTIILEDVICKQKGIKFINEILKTIPVEAKKRKIKHFDYVNYFKTHKNRLRVYLSNRNFVNTYYKYLDYEVIIIDDAHMLTTGEYNNLFKGKQVVICGDYQSNKIVNQNLISLANSVDTLTFKNRYILGPRKLTNGLMSLSAPHMLQYNNNNGVKVIEKGLEDYLYNIYMQDCNIKINFFIKNINHQREAYENICKSFFNKNLPFDEIFKFLNNNIRICDINVRNYMTSDYNILYLKDYCFEDSQIISSNLFEILLLAKNELIIYDHENNLLKNIELNFFKSIKKLVLSEEIFINNQINAVTERIVLKLNELGYKVYNTGNGIDMLIQREDSDELIILLILFNNGNVSEVLNVYRDFYDQFIKMEHRVITRTMVDLIAGEEKFMKGLLGEINGKGK